MRWSKVRSLVKERFAPELAGRLDINSTRYGNSSMGHAWLTWDGEVIANFCTHAYAMVGGYWREDKVSDRVGPGPLARYGEFSREDAYDACWAFLHDLSIEEALTDSDPLVNALALADARVGKRRLKLLEPDRYHPLAAQIIALREGA